MDQFENLVGQVANLSSGKNLILAQLLISEYLPPFRKSFVILSAAKNLPLNNAGDSSLRSE
jgi:hypothetical protein